MLACWALLLAGLGRGVLVAWCCLAGMAARGTEMPTPCLVGCNALAASHTRPHPHHRRFPPFPQGRRLFVFIVGGVTLSEMRCAHRLSTKLGRDVFLGGTSEWSGMGGDRAGWVVGCWPHADACHAKPKDFFLTTPGLYPHTSLRTTHTSRPNPPTRSAGVETPARFMRHVADLTSSDHLALEVDGGGGGGGGGFFRFGS